MIPSFHHFRYVYSHDSQRGIQPSDLRDVAAAWELLPVLSGMGYRQGESILNWPPMPLWRKHDPRNVPVEEVAVPLPTGDLVLTTTRPPMEDEAYNNRKRVRRGHTDVEKKLFRCWRRYLDRCARSEVRLSEELWGLLPEGRENRNDIKFFQEKGASYRLLMSEGRWRKAPPGLTAVYLLHVEEAWQGGPGLLGVFGINATATLVWSYRLARDFPQLLREPGFAMGEMRVGSIPERPTDLRWARDWEIEILLRCPPLDPWRASGIGAAPGLPTSRSA